MKTFCKSAFLATLKFDLLFLIPYPIPLFQDRVPRLPDERLADGFRLRVKLRIADSEAAHRRGRPLGVRFGGERVRRRRVTAED